MSDPTQPLVPLLVDADALATLLCISPRQVSRLNSAGKLPPSITLGRCRRWRVDEVREWLAAGGPPRSRWNLRSGVACTRASEQGHGRR